MKNFIKVSSIAALLALPVSVFAAQTLTQVFTTVGELIGTLTPIIVALALMAFFWGLAMYVLNFSGEDKDKKKGRDMMVYGLLVLFVMVSVWGIVNILQQTFSINDSDSRLQGSDIPRVDVPQVQP
ncbi:hypothetical protein K2P56_02210 [Patescibacteria group bacterium]|nr:hypothetical protein [Patescibacteria group bacterium]